MEAQDVGFESTVTPWKNEFRVMFAPPGATVRGLDETVHYIFSGFYAATVDNGGLQQWAAVMGARDGAPQEERELLLSTEPSDGHVAKLRELLQARSPLIEPLFDDDELRRYFGRRTFRGAVVECNRMHSGEWLVLLGDAAHSVLPPTGEGINSALEDAMVLAACVRDAPEAPFSRYNAVRSEDITGLLRYARYLNEGADLKVPGEGGARLAFTILESLLGKCGVIPLTESLFGPRSVEREPYGAMMARWRLRGWLLRPLARLLIFPFAWLLALVRIPLAIPSSLRAAARGERRALLGKPKPQMVLKPPIDLEEVPTMPHTAAALAQ